MRRASSLIELAAAIAIAGAVIAAAGTGLGRLRRLADADVQLGARAERVCLQLRRDLAAGPAQWRDGALRIATGAREVEWRVESGRLLRNGCLQVAVLGFAVEPMPAGLAVTVAPPGLPPRRIEVWR